MLEYALSLISEGKYLSDEDPFADIDKARPESRWVSAIPIVAAALILLVLLATLFLRKSS